MKAPRSNKPSNVEASVAATANSKWRAGNVIATTVVSTCIIALLSTVALWTKPALTDGTIVRWMGGYAESTEPQNFSTAHSRLPIPGSEKAKFCALTRVSIASGGGTCYVEYDVNIKRWVWFNAGSDCSVACIQ